MSRADLQARVDALRAELRAAERALADSYGPGVEALALFLRAAFQDSELRRLVRYRWPGLPDEIPPGIPMSALCDTVACMLATHGVEREPLRATLLRERPRRQQDIDHALASWGGQ